MFHIYIISGWTYDIDLFNFIDKAFPSQVTFIRWQSLLKDNADINDIQEKLINRITLENHKEIILLGWSLGAFLLYPLLKLPKITKAFFLSLAPSFVQTDEFPQGVSFQKLSQMKRQFDKIPEKTIKLFQSQCQHGKPLEENISYSQDQKGAYLNALTLLESIQLFKFNYHFSDLIFKNQSVHKLVYFFHGKNDSVVHYSGSLLLGQLSFFKTYNYMFNAKHYLLNDLNCSWLIDLIRKN